MPLLIQDNLSPLGLDGAPRLIVDNLDHWARAVRIPYIPTTPGDWASLPKNVREALDEARATFALFLPLVGGTLTGALTINADFTLICLHRTIDAEAGINFLDAGGFPDRWRIGFKNSAGGDAFFLRDLTTGVEIFRVDHNVDGAMIIHNEFALPIADGTDGQSVKTNGADVTDFYDDVHVGTSPPADPPKTRVWMNTDAAPGGEAVLKITTVTGDVTLTKSNHAVRCDTTLVAITVNLPTATGNEGRRFKIKNVGTGGNDVTVDPFGSELIEGASTVTLVDSPDKEAIEILSNNTSWEIW